MEDLVLSIQGFLSNTEILMPKLTERDYHNMNIDQSFKAFKWDDLKVVYSLKIDIDNTFQKN